MDHKEAKEQFLLGKFHPHCPECKGPMPIRFMDKKIVDGIYWQYYMCMKGHPFKATVMEAE